MADLCYAKIVSSYFRKLTGTGSLFSFSQAPDDMGARYEVRPRGYDGRCLIARMISPLLVYIRFK